jgi:repressor LexA
VNKKRSRKRKTTLSKRQTKILEFLQDFIGSHHYPPTIREIGAAAKISSTSVVNYNLNRLEELGYIERERTVSRGLRLLKPLQEATQSLVEGVRDFIEVPVVGRIVAGEPVPVPGSDFEYLPDETISLARGIIQDESDLFALQVQGNSMIDELITDGDTVILRRQQTAENGETVAAWLRDQEETTLKKFYLERDGRVRLQPANPYLDPIFTDPKNVRIQGKVVMVIRQLH